MTVNKILFIFLCSIIITVACSLINTQIIVGKDNLHLNDSDKTQMKMGVDNDKKNK